MSSEKSGNSINFSDRVKLLRNNRGITQESLGEVIGLSTQAINDIERGRSKTTIDKAVMLADFFGVSLDYLVGRTDDPTPPGK